MTTHQQSSKDNETQRKYRRYLEAEREAVALYSAMLAAEQDAERRKVFQGLVESEQRHVAHWAAKLGIPHPQSPTPRKTARVRLLSLLAKALGARRVLPLVLRIEGEDTRMYGGDPEALQVMIEGEEHSQKLRDLREGHPSSGQEIAGKGWETAAAAGAFRAGVLGVNDGLVSNFGLVWGVAGGTSNPEIILLAGVAGLLAGAFSMAAGEYVSMRADRDLTESRIEKERREMEEFPQEEQEELSLIYRMKGLTKEEADLLAARVMQNKEVALETMVREELGLDPDQLGSPWGAAISSFLSFSLGAVVPVVPYLFGVNSMAFLASGALTGLALLLVGGVLASISNKNALWGSLRMLLVGALAGALTNGIGRLVGVALE
ncbi:MAG: VIT1/CCC1 transporter family protein [Chloroflexi bacterium]|nr:VIT1/CCC1 transporter family protein [Chloroflexota bacterium]